MQIGSFIRRSSSDNFGMGLKKAPFWVFIILGLIMVAGGIYFIADGQKTAQWPKTQATVRDINTNVEYDSNGDKQTRHRYTLSYTVNDNEYTTNISSDVYFTVGSTTEIAYNPDKPSDTRTDGQRQWTAWLILAGGIIMTIFATIFTFNKRVRDVVSTQPPAPITPQQPIQPTPTVPQPQQTPPQPPQVPPTIPPLS